MIKKCQKQVKNDKVNSDKSYLTQVDFELWRNIHLACKYNSSANKAAATNCDKLLLLFATKSSYFIYDNLGIDICLTLYHLGEIFRQWADRSL